MIFLHIWTNHFIIKDLKRRDGKESPCCWFLECFLLYFQKEFFFFFFQNRNRTHLNVHVSGVKQDYFDIDCSGQCLWEGLWFLIVLRQRRKKNKKIWEKINALFWWSVCICRVGVYWHYYHVTVTLLI